jgi:RNA polymerase sigma factor (sigma-70 family)
MIQRSRVKDTDELLSDCNLWLLQCIESFNIQFNIKFSSYLCKAIWHNTSRYGKKRIFTKSLCIKADDDGDGDNLEYDPNSTINEPSYELSVKESKMLVHKALRSSLNQRELDIIVARYGIDGKPPRTLKEVGEQLSLNRERVRQIQVTAERKLSKNSELLHGLEAI